MAPRPVGVTNGVTRSTVLDYLLREADLDGLVTVSEAEVARAVGLAQGCTAGYHLDKLVEEGVLTPAGVTERASRGAGRQAYLIADELL